MSTPKRQHTVPKVYLKNFADNDGRLTITSKRNDMVSRPFPKDALIRKYYYSQPVDSVDNQYHEFETKLLGQLESKYPRLYESIVEGNKVDLELFFETICSMRIRSVGFREPFEIALADYVKRYFDTLPETFLPPKPANLKIDKKDLVVAVDPHRSLQSMAHYVTHHCTAISASSFYLVAPSRGKTFYTSDNPVVWFDKNKSGPPSKLFGTNPTNQTRVFFPLNPKLGVVGHLTNDADNSLRLNKRILSMQDTNILNYAIYASAWDHVVGTSKIPNAMKDAAKRLSPELTLTNYSPDDGSFDVVNWTLAPFRSKTKYHRPT